MNRILHLLALSGSLGLLPSCQTAPIRTATLPEASAGNTLLISYSGQAVPPALERAIKRYGATVRYRYEALHGLAIVVPAGKTPEAAMHYFQAIPGVLSVRPDAVEHLH